MQLHSFELDSWYNFFVYAIWKFDFKNNILRWPQDTKKNLRGRTDPFVWEFILLEKDLDVSGFKIIVILQPSEALTF